MSDLSVVSQFCILNGQERGIGYQQTGIGEVSTASQHLCIEVLFMSHSAPNKAWCVLINHRLLTGESPVLVRVRPPDSRQPMQSGD